MHRRPEPCAGKVDLVGLVGLVVALLMAGLGLPAVAATPWAQPAAEQRCGWFQNPTPGNAWLMDRHGRWTIGLQGGHQAEGDWPSFTDAQWVATNGFYGYGCACLRMAADPRTHRVARIFSTAAKPLAACRQDRSLQEPRD